MVRQRSRTGQGKTKRSLSRKDSSGSVSEQLPGRDEGKCRNLLLIFCSCVVKWKIVQLTMYGTFWRWNVKEAGFSVCCDDFF